MLPKNCLLICLRSARKTAKLPEELQKLPGAKTLTKLPWIILTGEHGAVAGAGRATRGPPRPRPRSEAGRAGPRPRPRRSGRWRRPRPGVGRWPAGPRAGSAEGRPEPVPAGWPAGQATAKGDVGGAGKRGDGGAGAGPGPHGPAPRPGRGRQGRVDCS